MPLTLRPAVAADAADIGRICYDAFSAIADERGFPREFPSVEFAIQSAEAFVGQPKVYAVVAELDGAVVGSNFLREYNEIAGIGPLSVAPALHDRKIGRALMEDVLERAASLRYAGVRLTQAAHNERSLALYLRLGFVVRESLAMLKGAAIGTLLSGSSVRLATGDDRSACDALCRTVHGHTRSGEVARGIERQTASVVEREGRITGYASSLGLTGHSVGESDDDLRALIGAAEAFGGDGLLVPLRNGELVRWCLEHGLRIEQSMTLMTIGRYREPEGAWLPSVIY